MSAAPAGLAGAGEGDGAPPLTAATGVATSSSSSSLFVDEALSVSIFIAGVPGADATGEEGRLTFGELRGLPS